MSGTRRWAFFVGMSETTNGAAVHFSSDLVPDSTAWSVIAAAEANGATFDDVLDALGDDASTLADTPSGLRGSLVPAIRLQHHHPHP